jgi:hypothetical protein
MVKYILPANISIETSIADPDPLVSGTDPWIRIRTKMSRIRKTYQNLGRHFWPKKFELSNMFFS